jgi:adenine-specific DNA-methyltransferase
MRPRTKRATITTPRAKARRASRKANGNGHARKPDAARDQPTADLRHQDAFEFLAELKPGSVDLIVSSPPYFMGKEYDRSASIDDFVADHKRLAPLLVRALRDGGSLCWQVGHHVKNGVVTPLDLIVYPIFAAEEGLFLRNRIIWTFGHGVHATKRFSGRHETILWFTKGHDYLFDLDSVRVPQKYPGKRHYKGPHKGEWSGNPNGKNPSDVWDIPNVKARHVEKTEHPCQFPVALVQRLVRGLTKRGGLVVDPFVGSGSSAVAAVTMDRNFSGCDINLGYVTIARNRLTEFFKGRANVRSDLPPSEPNINQSVSRRPPHFNEKELLDAPNY